jgi:hypothetical protein
MENKFKAGDIAYVSVEVCEDKPADWDYNVKISDKCGGALKFCVNEGELFSVADFGTSNGIDWQAKYNEYNEKAEAKIRELATRLNDMAESLREAQAKAVNLNSALKDQIAVNTELEGKNDELETTVSELSVLVNNLRKEIAQREEGWDNVSRNNDIAVYNLNRLCKQREVLTDRIIALEAELEAEREKHNG